MTDTPDTFLDVRAKAMVLVRDDGSCWVLAEDYRASEVAREVLQGRLDGELDRQYDENCSLIIRLAEAEAQVAALHAELSLSRPDLRRDIMPPNSNILSSTSDVATARDNRLRAEGVEQAADVLKQRWESYDAAHGSIDPSTGVTEYPGDGAEWVYEWQELEEDIRAEATKLRGENHD